MKHSIRLKITLLLVAMITFTILLTWAMNRSFLSSYYIHSKINDMDEVYDSITRIYRNSGDPLSLSDTEMAQIERIKSNYDVTVYVFMVNGVDLIPSFPATENFGNREFSQIMKIIQGHQFSGTNPDIEDKVVLEEGENYWIYSLHDRTLDNNYMDMVGFFSSKSESSLDNDSMVLLRSNLESIQESATIANEFLAYVGIIAIIIGTIAIFIISKKFTKPILDLAGIAKKMSDLDFEVRYEVNTKDEIGELGSSINILSDKLEATILELKNANNELLSDIQKKTEIDEMRKEFLSNVSHELKTPISLIQGYAEGLKENINEDEESRNFYCDVIMDEASKMNNMVKKLLSLNELEFGNNQVNIERFDIVALIHSVLEATDILLKQKEVIVVFEEQDPIYVWADEYLVEQVVVNYVSNAINHVSGSNIIEIKLIPRDDVLRVAVFNTGENIPEDELNKIWIKFYKVDKSRSREYGGSGIGLSIVKAIMNSLNRECGVINRPVGVEFWFELDMKA